MGWRSLLLLSVCGLLCAALGEERVEYGGGHASRHQHTVDGEHNVEYDHEAVIGSRSEHEDFENLSPEEAKERLSELIDKMDTNQDGSISLEELVSWVYNSFKSLDAEEASEYFDEQDEDSDGKVTLQEYLENQYGFSLEEMEKWYEDLTPEVQHYAKMVTDDKEKFGVADRDGDGALNEDEYHGFYHPWSRDYMHDLEISRTLDEQDTNSDGFVDLAEYLGDAADNHESALIEKENFISFDSDGDGRLDRDELRAWVLPDHEETAQDEAEHLMSETDANEDGLLSKQEILDRYQYWVASAATDYGMQLERNLHDPEEL